MKFSFVGAAAVLAAAALATAGVASAEPGEDTFLATLDAGGFEWTGDGQPLIDLGREICAEMDSGTSAADIITQGAQELDWTPTQVGYFVGAAASEFCPQNLQRAMEEAKTLEG